MINSIEKINEIESMAQQMRLDAIDMALYTGDSGAHLGGSLSCIEIFAVLFGGIMNFDVKNPHWINRDKFIPSKAHCGLAHFPALAHVGFIKRDEMAEEYIKDNGCLFGHPMNINIGLEYSGGSLGMALSVGIGWAIISKEQKRCSNIYILMGDGELHEGSNWEAFMAAAHYKLNNITVIIDRNYLCMDGNTEDIMAIDDLSSKMKSFNWNVSTCDGHNVPDLLRALSERSELKPNVIIAETIKGKGVSFMENKREWHHSRLSQIQYENAKKEILNKSGNI